MQYHTSTPVPERLADDLEKARITVRYRDNQYQQHVVEFNGCFIEFVPRIVGMGKSGGRDGEWWTQVPLSHVQSIEVDDEYTSPCDTDYRGEQVPQRLVVARWHETVHGLLRFIPQGNA